MRKLTAKEEQKILDNIMWYIKNLGRRGIFDVYKVPSGQKIEAWTQIRNKCIADNGRCYTVLGANCTTFSAMYIRFDKPTKKWILEYFTRYYDYHIPLTNDQAKEILKYE